MSLLLIYGSTHGTTAACARELEQLLNIRPVVTTGDPGRIGCPLTDFEAVIIGSAIRLGRINKKIAKFCRRQEDWLLTVKVGLFVCCLNGPDQAAAYLADQFPAALRERTVACGYFGGRLQFDQLTALERSLLKPITGSEADQGKIRH